VETVVLMATAGRAAATAVEAVAVVAPVMVTAMARLAAAVVYSPQRTPCDDPTCQSMSRCVR
jgi:hypothetical protein